MNFLENDFPLKIVFCIILRKSMSNRQNICLNKFICAIKSPITIHLPFKKISTNKKAKKLVKIGKIEINYHKYLLYMIS